MEKQKEWKVEPERVEKFIEFVKNYAAKGWQGAVSSLCRKSVEIVEPLYESWKEYERKIADGEFVSKEWHDEQVLHANEEVKNLKEENVYLKIHVDTFFDDCKRERKRAEAAEKAIGKFKDQSALLKAYEALEKEFTRRSQRLRELQRKEEQFVAASHEECAEFQNALQQKEKDVAREILQGLIEKAYSSGCIDLTVNEAKAWFREDYGVEVE